MTLWLNNTAHYLVTDENIVFVRPAEKQTYFSGEIVNLVFKLAELESKEQ